jgi:phage tail sheath protein FI
MPQQLGAPGVYVEEVPSGRRVIRAVSTNIAAFIDYFREGPMNEAVQIFGTSDFDRIFGGYDNLSEASFAIPQFFLNGGTTAFVIRTAAAASDGSNTPTAASAILQDEGGTGVLQIAAANPGEWGNNLRVEIDHDVPPSTDSVLRFNLRVTRFASNQGNARGLVTETYLNLSMDEGAVRYAPTVINDASSLVTAAAVTTTLDGTLRPAATGTTGGDISSLSEPDFDQIGKNASDNGTVIDVTIAGQDRGSVVASVTLAWDAGDVTTLAQLRGRLEAAIRSAEPTDPSFAAARVTLANGRMRVLSGRPGVNYKPLELVAVSDPGPDATAATLKLDTASAAIENVQHYTLGRANPAVIGALAPADVGANGVPPGPDEILGSDAVDPPTGMHALDRVDLFNILCIPRAADLTDTNMDAVISNAISYCEDRRAFMIVDIPSDRDHFTEIKDWLDANAQYRSRNSAVYFPRVRVPDPTNEFRLRSIGASGTMAGIYARTDTSRGVWKAPAGIEALLEGVSELAAPMNDGENGVLNPLGINALRNFPVYGNIAWGTRTLVGADALASEWAYIPVRRLALMLEESLFRGTKWVVFEPNAEPTWANIRLNIGGFLNGLFRQGAFAGATPRDAYYVKCDSETTTQNDIDQGIVNIEVGFAPLKPAEFVVIRFRQIVGDVEV